MAEATSTLRLSPDRGLILGSLLALSAAAWAILIWQSTEMSDDMSLTMGMGAPVFIALWIVMMVAIMYPTASPMIMAFARIHSDRRERGQPFVSTWVFAGAYILLWSSTAFSRTAWRSAEMPSLKNPHGSWTTPGGSAAGF